ncbi:MAG: sodium-translocating pyrophosphatase [Acidobacteria bacterium RBG_13_68_16]|nr:MAG: sodium-translocating pyrophosphatase [Acidobacteria bacterium RBG_13_68_16]
MTPTTLLAIVLGVSAASLAVAWALARWVLRKDDGTPEMRAISDPIREGAEGFLHTQYGTIAKLAGLVTVLLFVLYAFVRKVSPNDPVGAVTLALFTAAAFILGALCSGLAGYTGMWVSVRSNIRAASAARRSGNEAIQVALRGGAVSGLMVVALSLLGVGGLYALLYAVYPENFIGKIPLMIVGYGFGASFVALFAQLGGGIYTKAADVGADLVGKVEAGIPEDDPRNPAVIADLVGDNVGDCAGRGADLFESTAAENIGAMILGATLAYKNPGHIAAPIAFILFPLVARAFGLVASIVGILKVKAASEEEDPMKSLNRGFAWAVALALVGFVVATRWLLYTPAAPQAWWHFALCGAIGIMTSWAFVWITQYYTEYRFRPVQMIANASTTGHATNIIAGISVGLESTALPTLVISTAIVAAYKLGESSGLEGSGLFGTAVATMGMLATAAFILAMDTFGPIADNAGGIAEMSGQPPEVRHKTDRLDAVGNTTKALTKGYAVGSAALAAFLLFSAYMDEVGAYIGKPFESVNIAVPEIFVGGLLGAMLVFLFSAWAIQAVGKAAQSIITEVRRQFRERPGIMAGTEKPDYSQCVTIVTQAALKEMVRPGLLVVGMPIAVGVIFRFIGGWSGRPLLGAETVASLLMIGTISGILMGNFLNNGGGSWDNAKKYIEMGNLGGKGSDAHKAAVTGDTVGDPFKDTAGPSLHVLVKLLSTITLVLAPFFLA